MQVIWKIQLINIDMFALKSDANKSEIRMTLREKKIAKFR